MRTSSLVYKVLDRRALRPVLQVVASGGITVKHDPCWVSYHGGAWVHHYREGRFASPTVGSPTLAEQLEKTNELYLHGYDPRPGDTIVDVGAGVGTEMLGFARAVGPTGRVIAIEAHPVTHRYLELNRRLNGLDNVETLQVAVSDAPGQVFLTDVDNHLANSIVAAADGPALAVPAVTLDDLVDRLDVARVDFVKMNIEGAEIAALRGARRMLQRTRYLYVSCHDFVADAAAGRGRDDMRTRDEVRRILSEAGFEVSALPQRLMGSGRPNDPRPSLKDVVCARAPGEA